MPQLTNIDRFNWKKLNAVIERLKEVIDRNDPLEGDGIRIVETNNGKQISVAQEIKGTPGTGTTTQQVGGGSPGVPITIQAFDTNNNPVTITVFTDGNGLSPSTLVWQQVATIDPATCAQSTITVLEKPSR